MKTIGRLLLLLAVVSSASATPNSEMVLHTGARVTLLPNFVYRVSFTYSCLINGWSYDPNGSTSSDYFLILGKRETAYSMAGTPENAAAFFIGEGFRWATDSAYFSLYFAATLPDRWDASW
jgi:hypothetical protein